MKMNNKKGFTLVELLAVIVILAIILVIAVPQIMNAIEKSKKGSIESSAKLVSSELELKYNAALTVGESFDTTGSCISYGNLDTDEYDTCTYTITNGKASVTLTGKTGGKFDGYVCTDATKVEATCTKGSTVTTTLPEPKLDFGAYEWSEIKTLAHAAATGDITYEELTSTYNLEVGQTRTITLDWNDPCGEFDTDLYTCTSKDVINTYDVRIANMSNPTECSTDGFSETACGFVVEFVDIVTIYTMNQTYTNVGGWNSSGMNSFVNNSLYNAIVEDIGDIIADTTVVSGHGDTSSEDNFTTTNKVYLLSAHELWDDVDEDTSDGVDYYDTAYNNTRQLDYYANNNLTNESNEIFAIKQYGNMDYYWWLRSSYSCNSTNFICVDDSGYFNMGGSYSENGLSPAFRIS